ncbi:MAG: OmpA family protein [Verrucomicrobiales bacterium]
MLLVSCQHFESKGGATTPLPPRDNTLSLFALGRESLDRNRFEAAHFSQGTWTLSPRETAKVRRVAEHLKPGTPLLLAGFGVEAEGPEAARILSMRRALEVRQLLMACGVDASTIHCTGFGADWPGESHSARVEFGVVK